MPPGLQSLSFQMSEGPVVPWCGGGREDFPAPVWALLWAGEGAV
jgi:hypothetical protein